MKLSELKTGESGVISKVYGHGGFRKRIVEMGFIKGTMVKSVLNAPLNDPVKYKLLDYEVSLRRAEADLVECVTQEEAEAWRSSQTELPSLPAEDCSFIHHVAERKGKELNVVFVGNPNCGKTSLFNIAGNAHERVGNYSGVTVDAKHGSLNVDDYKFDIVDLPGTYSLSAYTPEELYVRKYIIEQTPDVIINVIDASNLERNLYLTAQLIDMDVPMIIALNMYDELRESGNTLDIAQLSKLLGVPIVPTIGRTGEGVIEIFRTIIRIYEGKEHTYRHIHVNHGKMLEQQIEKLEEPIRKNPEPHQNYSGRFLAIKLLENDRQIEHVIDALPNKEEILAVRKQCQAVIMRDLDEDSESAITDAKYGFVQGALKECFKRKSNYKRQMTKRIDSVVANHVWGYPIFLFMMYLMFYCTFNIGQYPMDWIEQGVKSLSQLLATTLPDGMLKDLIVDGIIAGVGGVIIFLPNILILYTFISWMEDSGYMARAAFIMDKIMHRMGLHGKSFIPMIMGFGCGIPAIMATRTIEDRKSRIITMLIIPLMSCSARLPVYIIIIGVFFPRHSAFVLFSLYLLGIVMSVLMAHIFSKFVVKGDTSPFVMELPPYRLPLFKSVLRHTWEKGKQYLRKMGTTILAASIIIWALIYFPQSSRGNIEDSYLGQIGQAISPALNPCGFDWRADVCLLTGIGAKEIVASTMQILNNENESGTIGTIGTPLSAASFLIFVLLYMPCIPACIAIRNESGKWKWAIFTAAYTTLLAWICSTLVFQLGLLIL
ncbi:MAG: ferrous iron transport protein B [Prevotellaceae bacterium]|nr:ferrous iron transport protein B [Prevotellaceae bacterium]